MRNMSNGENADLFGFLNRDPEKITFNGVTQYQVNSKDSGNLDRSFDAKGDWMWDPTWERAVQTLFPGESRSTSVLEWVKSGFRLEKPRVVYHAPFSMREEDLDDLKIVDLPDDLSYENFFDSNGAVLDITSGTSKMMRGIIKEHPQLSNYYVVSDGKFNSVERNENIIVSHDDELNFDKVPLSSVSRILSQSAVAKKIDDAKLADQITAIAEPDCIFRYIQYRGRQGLKSLDELLNDRGWKVWHVPGVMGEKRSLRICRYALSSNGL